MKTTKKKGIRNFRTSISHGMRGWFAVLLADYEDIGWSTDVVQTGIGSYKDKEDAILEAKEWALSEQIKCECDIEEE
jgi:hypothetical protein